MSIWATVTKAIIGDGLGNNIVDYMKRRAELKQALHERKLELIKEGLHADAAWELEQIKNSGWKDEWVLMLISVPLIGCFIPRFQAAVLEGFAILEQCPGWYKWMVVTILAAIYGIRVWRRQITDT